MASVDLNADLGESFGRWVLGDDEALCGIITSANVACGFHAGDPRTLLRTCRQAAAAQVVIGAQVGYRDLAGFGRRFIDIDSEDLTADVLYQISALDGIAAAAGARVQYLKPHGALYHATHDDEVQAAAVVQAITLHGRSLPVLAMAGSALLRRAATAGLPVVTEWFVDRGYDADGRLLPRQHPGGVLTDPVQAAERAVRAADQGHADSFCLHGDTPGAVDLGRAVRSALLGAGHTLAPFARGADHDD